MAKRPPRSEAAKRGWETRRARAAQAEEAALARQRSKAAKKGWKTRRKRIAEEATMNPQAQAMRGLQRKVGKRAVTDMIEDYAEDNDLDLHDAFDLFYGYT